MQRQYGINSLFIQKLRGTLQPYLRHASLLTKKLISLIPLSNKFPQHNLTLQLPSPIVYPSPLFILADEEELQALGWLGELGKLCFQTQILLTNHDLFLNFFLNVFTGVCIGISLLILNSYEYKLLNATFHS